MERYETGFATVFTHWLRMFNAPGLVHKLTSISEDNLGAAYGNRLR